MATVIGPTPPGTGVIQAARARAAGNSSRHQVTARQAVHAHVDDDRAGPHPLAGDEPGFAGGHDQDVGAAHVLAQVHGEAVTHRCRGAGEQQFERHRSAHDVGGTHDDRVLALEVEGCADVLQKADDPVGRAGTHERDALREAADVVGMEPIHVLRRVDPLDHRGAADLFRQGQLHQDAIDGQIVVEGVDQREQARLGSVRRQIVRQRQDPDLLAGAALVAHVDRRGCIFAHLDHRQSRPAASAGEKRLDAAADVALNGSRELPAVDQLCRHGPSSVWWASVFFGTHCPMRIDSGRFRTGCLRVDSRRFLPSGTKQPLALSRRPAP